MSEEAYNKKGVAKKQKQLRYFISSLNSFVGHSLVEALRNDHINDENPHFIVGSLCKNEDNEVPKGVLRVIDTSKINFLSKVFIDSDVIIYDLNTCDLAEAEFAIKTLRMGEYNEEKILICISSVMVWSSTPPKEKIEGVEIEEGEADEEGEGDEDEVDNAAAGGEGEEVAKKTYLRFTERDYTQRKPLPNYELLKSIETMCISAGNSKKNLRTFVLCSGILYGDGEDVFYSLFRQAWLQEPPALPIIGDGRNRMPTVHVRDLAQFVRACIEKKPPQQYIFAIDHTPRPLQKKIVEAISRSLGTGKTVNVSLQEAALTNTDFDKFYIDLRLRPTRVFDALEEGEEGNADGEEDPNAPLKFKFQWHSKEGLVRNLKTLVDEFNQFRGLRPNRILVQGPPASGKSHFARLLAKHYNIPHIKIGEVVDQVKKLQNELGEEIRTTWEELQEKAVRINYYFIHPQTKIEEAQAAFEAEKKKSKKTAKKGEVVEEFDPKKVLARLPDELLFKAYQWRLVQPDCYNRGFVLDGFPKTYAQAQGVFLMPKPVAEGEEDRGEDQPKIVNPVIMPQSVIFIEGTDEFLKGRIKQQPEDVLLGTHWTEEVGSNFCLKQNVKKGMNRRLAVYRIANNKDKGDAILADFFKEQAQEVLKINAENAQNSIFDQTRSFIERNGSFANYMTAEQELEERRKLEVQSTLQDEHVKLQKKDKQRDDKEEENRRVQQEEHKIKVENLKNQEREILDTRSQPLRQYLADNVVPFLTEGLIEICKNPTNDPVDALAEYLFKRSLEVQFPDPSSYNP